MSNSSVSWAFASTEEVIAYQELAKIMLECPIPSSEILANLSLFMTRSALSHLLFMHHLYYRILTVPGVVFEFGTRYGRNLALLTTLRAIFEPHNFSRKIVGFDTFAGFPSVASQDGTYEGATVGSLSVMSGYEDYLGHLLTTHERLAPRSHLKKHELIKGDVTETLPRYLANHPEAIIALAYFDLDLYEPTKKCLALIKDHLTKGSIIGFDELTLAEFPGETLAFKEEFGTSNYEIKRTPFSNYQSFIVL